MWKSIITVLSISLILGLADLSMAKHLNPIQEVSLRIINSFERVYDGMAANLALRKYHTNSVTGDATIPRTIISTSSLSQTAGNIAEETSLKNVEGDSLKSSSNCSYYVSLTGSNRNSGNIDQPFRTINHAVSKLSPGETLCVRGGDYRENFPGWDYGHIDGIKGTPSSPIMISAYQQETPVLSTLTIKNSEWLVFDGFKIEGYRPLLDNWKDLPEIIIDDPNVGAIDPDEKWRTREAKIHQKYSTYIKIKDDFANSWTSGVMLKNTHNCVIRNSDISKFTSGIHVAKVSSNNRIQNNSIHHTVNAVFTWGKPDVTGAENNIISNNHFYQNFNAAIRLLRNAKGNIVENNLVEYSGVSHMGTKSGSSENVFRNNTLLHAGYYAETMRNPGPSAMDIHSSGPGNLVEGNFIAYQLDVTDNDGGGIITDYTNHQTIIRNNIIYRNMGHGFVSTHSGKNLVVNNLFIENGYKSTTHKFGIAMAKKEDVDHVIANNIFYKNKTGGMSFGGRLKRQKYIDHNLFYQPKTLIVVDSYRDKKTRYDDLSRYRKATGFGAHSISSNPLFVDPDHQDFRLSTQSPAIDAGSTSHFAPADKNGNMRPAGNGVDIGAYETTHQ